LCLVAAAAAIETLVLRLPLVAAADAADVVALVLPLLIAVVVVASFYRNFNKNLQQQKEGNFCFGLV